MMEPQSDIILQMLEISKLFPGVIANDHISFDLKYGEIHALLGENGAGKSTLMNILAGMYHPDHGEIYLEGRPVIFDSAREAIHRGIGMVYQHFMLIPKLSVVENIILGIRQPREPFLDINGACRKITEFARQYGMDIDPHAKVWQLSVGQRQRVEIVKALFRGAKILVLDEPTAVLTPQETEELFRMVRRYTADRFAVIFISHKINEVLAVSDRITILQRGRKIATLKNGELDKYDIARMMVGREVNFTPDKAKPKWGTSVLELKEIEALSTLGRPVIRQISFSLCRGEILGIAGVDGNGQSELVEVITGLRTASGGKVSN